MKDCCKNKSIDGKKGFWQGILFGIIPHSFCILFILFSAFGAIFATEYLKKFLLIPNFFTILVAFSFIFALIAAIIYLYRSRELNFTGVKNNYRYLAILFGSTIILNIIFIYVIFPSIANLKNEKQTLAIESTRTKTLLIRVDIPCPGHAPLIIDELKKIKGVGNVQFIFPNQFSVMYNVNETNGNNILEADIFKNFKAEKL